MSGSAVGIEPGRPRPGVDPAGLGGKVVVAAGTGLAGRRYLQQHGHRVVVVPNRGALRAQLVDADAVITDLDQLSPQMLGTARRLRIMAVCDLDVARPDLDFVRARGVQVVDLRDCLLTDRVEQVLALILTAARTGALVPQPVRPMRLRDSCLGLIGLDEVGIEVARVCRSAFGMRVLCYVPDGAEQPPDAPFEPVGSLPALFGAAGMVVVLSPSGRAGTGLIGPQALAAARPGLRLVSTAGPGVVVPEELQAALGDGRVALAVVDTRAARLSRGSGLWSAANFVSLSGAAAATESMEAMSLAAAKQIHAVLSAAASQPGQRTGS